MREGGGGGVFAGHYGNYALYKLYFPKQLLIAD